jgi:large subunit ribosomal protein L32e
MTTEIKRLIQVRVDKGAVFKRDGYGKKRQLSDSWRKPRGQHNKQREQKKAKGALPKPGFGSPIAVRGMHPSGFFEILISSVKELEGFDPKTHAVRIRATVGERTRTGLQDKARAEGFKVLNARIVKTVPNQEKLQESVEGSEKDADTEKKEEKKSVKAKVTGLFRKDTKKVKKTPETEVKKTEVKKAPVKEKKSTKSKSKTESAEAPEKTKPAESAKPTKKSSKPKADSAETPEKTKPAVSAKSTRKSVKPKTEPPVEAIPEAAPKTKEKKKTETGVTKNE